MTEILLITLPVFLIVAAGWLAARVKLAKTEWVHVLNIFVYYIGLPALILHGFWRLDLQQAQLGAFVALNVGTISLAAVFLAALIWLLPLTKPNKAGLFMAAMVS